MDGSFYASPESMAHQPPMPRVPLSETDRKYTATPRGLTGDSSIETLGRIPRQNTTGTVISSYASSTAVPARATSYDSLHIEIPHQFGETDEYWEQYNKLADRHDKERVEVLNNTLDTLLIFGGLFSAVTTSFMMFYLPMLSPPPDAHTVALLKLIALGRTNLTAADLGPPPFAPGRVMVRTNCWLGLSLFLSLLASFCALMSKQAVLHFARDYPSTLETHGRWHQRKLRSVAKWQFQTIVEGLPSLLLIALVVFIIGVIEGLHVIGNLALTLVAAVFGIASVAGFLLLGIGAILFPEFPFQIPLTGFIRESGVWCWIRVSRMWRQARDSIEYRIPSKRFIRARKTDISSPRDVECTVDQTMDLATEDTEKEDDQVPARERNDDKTDTHTASWVLERSGRRETLLATAKNIPALRIIKGTRLRQGEPAYARLVSFFKNALTTWNMSSSYGRTTTRTSLDLAAALIYGRALVHCTIGAPPAASHSQRASTSRVLWPKWGTSPANELLLIKFCLDKKVPGNFCIDHTKNTLPDRSAALHIYLAAILESHPTRNTQQGDNKIQEKKQFVISATDPDRITLVQWLASMSFANQANTSPVALNIGAWSLGKLPDMISGMEGGFTQELRDDWWDAYTSERNLHKNVVKALNAYHYYQRLQGVAFQSTELGVQSDHWSLLGPESYVDLYTRFLRAFRRLIETGAYLHESHTVELDEALQQLRLTVSGRWHASGTPFQPNGMEQEIDETILCLRKDALTGIFRRLTDFVGGFVAAAPGEADITSTLYRHPEFPQMIVEALEKPKGPRYAALAMIRDDATKWFEDDTNCRILHQRFTGAGLLPALQSCMRCEEHLPLISDIIVQLMNSPLWAEQVAESRLLRAFFDRGKDVLQSVDGDHGRERKRGTRSFRIVEYILNVWRICGNHPKSKGLADEWHTPRHRQHLMGYIDSLRVPGQTGFQPSPLYVPESLAAYVTDTENRGINDKSAADLKDVYTWLTQELGECHDQDQDTPPSFPIAQHPYGSSILDLPLL
ncbi:hypothetical protein FRB99_006579 [Tulasnella sp. 403]|nr:hypothetical protein FRB99_006579 [Tulasnella sp. 403]